MSEQAAGVGEGLARKHIRVRWTIHRKCRVGHVLPYRSPQTGTLVEVEAVQVGWVVRTVEAVVAEAAEVAREAVAEKATAVVTGAVATGMAASVVMGVRATGMVARVEAAAEKAAARQRRTGYRRGHCPMAAACGSVCHRPTHTGKGCSKGHYRGSPK
jgi:hypothetical protein